MFEQNDLLKAYNEQFDVNPEDRIETANCFCCDCCDNCTECVGNCSDCGCTVCEGAGKIVALVVGGVMSLVAIGLGIYCISCICSG